MYLFQTDAVILTGKAMFQPDSTWHEAKKSIAIILKPQYSDLQQLLGYYMNVGYKASIHTCQAIAQFALTWVDYIKSPKCFPGVMKTNNVRISTMGSSNKYQH